MEGQFGIVLQQMLCFFILICIGFLAQKTGLLPDQVLDGLGKFVVNIAMPALILTVFPSAGNRSDLFKAFPVLLAACGIFFFLFLLGHFIAGVCQTRGNTRGVQIAMTMFGNMGFMGVPLVSVLYGTSGLFYFSMYSIVDMALLWTAGSILVSGHKSPGGLVKNLVTPTTISLVLGMLLLFYNVPTNNLVFETLGGLGDTTKYLAMVYIGGLLSQAPIGAALRRPAIYVIILLKMLLAPILIYWILFTWAGHIFSVTAIQVMTLIAALPCMTTLVIVAKNNKSDYHFATDCLFLTTLFSLVTIPVVIWLTYLF